MSNKFDNKETGRRGEMLAAEYLVRKGYRIIERNFSTRFGEIDLICEHNGVVVFVEVKTKKGLDFGRPEEMVGRGKIRKVKNMAIVYLKGREVACRIDVVAVVLQDGEKRSEIKHYENVVW